MTTADELRARGYVEGPEGWYKPKPSRADDPKQPAIVESHSRTLAQKTAPIEKSHSAKFLVRVTDVRIKLIDTDNLFVKWHVDLLRYAGCLLGDGPETTTIQVSQRKLKYGEYPHTEIEIFRLG